VILAATLPFAAAARNGLRATGVGYDRKVTVLQFIAGFVLFAASSLRRSASSSAKHLGADLPRPADRRAMTLQLS
jgi:hypothetical protein